MGLEPAFVIPFLILVVAAMVLDRMSAARRTKSNARTGWFRRPGLGRPADFTRAGWALRVAMVVCQILALLILVALWIHGTDAHDPATARQRSLGGRRLWWNEYSTMPEYTVRFDARVHNRTLRLPNELLEAGGRYKVDLRDGDVYLSGNANGLLYLGDVLIRLANGSFAESFHVHLPFDSADGPPSDEIRSELVIFAASESE